MQNAGEGETRPRRPLALSLSSSSLSLSSLGAVVGVLTLLCILVPVSIVPVPVSAPRAVARGSGWGCCGDSQHHRRHRGRLVLIPLAVSRCRRPWCPGRPVVWPGICPRHRFVVVSVVVHPSTLRAVARSGDGGFWVVLVVLFPSSWFVGLLLSLSSSSSLVFVPWSPSSPLSSAPSLSLSVSSHPVVLSSWLPFLFVVASTCSRWWGAGGRHRRLCLAVHPCPCPVVPVVGRHPVLLLS
jgi:hypothetical protein